MNTNLGGYSNEEDHCYAAVPCHGAFSVACGGSSAPAATEAPKADAPATNAPTAEAPTAEPVTIKVAAIETAYGSQVWVDVAAAFEAETGIKVELTTDKNLEDVLSGPMQNGEFPDVVHLATGRPAGLTEQLVKANALHPLTNALALTIPGETVKVSDKIAGGFYRQQHRCSLRRRRDLHGSHVLLSLRPVLQRKAVRGQGLGSSHHLGRDVGTGRDC